MFFKLFPALVVLSALSGSYATPAAQISYALPGGDHIITITTLGMDSSGHVTYSICLVITAATDTTTAAAPDTTITAAATLVDGPSAAHLTEVLTIAGQTVTVSEGCTLDSEKGNTVCTLVEHLSVTTVSSVVTVVSSGSNLSTVTASAPAGTGNSAAGRIGSTMFSLLAVVIASVVLGTAMSQGSGMYHAS
ncbi:hypothetical protein BD311DRAFT_812111 [Dichomitus squalens]|uniref:Uncharacterized protein n=1 Tax=Dichomitus squalens TaxID=114155 RepID=A0A4Q9M4D7_9APHY|nr:hypothetical protein BD311DRAFT_812111 [Dichomitus squalens]